MEKENIESNLNELSINLSQNDPNKSFCVNGSKEGRIKQNF